LLHVVINTNTHSEYTDKLNAPAVHIFYLHLTYVRVDKSVMLISGCWWKNSLRKYIMITDIFVFSKISDM